MERKRERERGIKRERKLFVPFLCVCVYLCARASSRVFVSLNIALCAVLCAHARCFFRKTTEGKGGVSLLLVAEKKKKKKKCCPFFFLL